MSERHTQSIKTKDRNFTTSIQNNHKIDMNQKKECIKQILIGLLLFTLLHIYFFIMIYMIYVFIYN